MCFAVACSVFCVSARSLATVNAMSRMHCSALHLERSSSLMLALAVNLCKRRQAIIHACSHKVMATRPIRCSKQVNRLANFAVMATSVRQSRLVPASCSAWLDIWPHTSEGEWLQCNGHLGAVLRSRQHRMLVIAAARFAVQIELRVLWKPMRSRVFNQEA